MFKPILGLTLIVVAGLFFFFFFNSQVLSQTELWLNGAKFEVEVAKTEEEQALGLSGRTKMAQNHGMLFVYDTPVKPRFWMKEMNFPLDIVWLDQNKKVVGVNQNLSPETFPKTFSSEIPVQYVLEVPANTCIHHKLKVGDLIHFSL